MSQFEGRMQAVGTPPDAPTQADAAESAQERLTRISRMRTLSAMLDDDVDEQLPPELLAMFSQNSAKLRASRNAAAANDDDNPANDFLCVECRAHESEVFCEQCHDYFCELCYGGQHRKGNRKKHTFQPRIVATASTSQASVNAGGVADDAHMQDEDEDSNEVRQCTDRKLRILLILLGGSHVMLIRIICP